jgi:hypothetical protein
MFRSWVWAWCFRCFEEMRFDITPKGLRCQQCGRPAARWIRVWTVIMRAADRLHRDARTWRKLS